MPSRDPTAADSPRQSHFVVGTAGHIDHGKTTLIRALTGRDLDSLPEEKARGITIALGFTWLDLPSGRRAAFVDVPGHERLVRTMIAGATGLDAALLCVSAVEGTMPQTREHLAILELLGVRQGVVALTMSDLVDEEMLELAHMDVEETVAGTFLEGAPVIATSAGPSPFGIEALIEALDALPSAVRTAEGVLRMPVDRAFVQRGFGTVVTGTVRSGRIADGEEVTILPDGIKARVRGLQVHGAPVAESVAGQRTAVNLAGIEREDLARGKVLVHAGTVEPASILDGRVRMLADTPPIPDGARVRLLLGTAEVMAALSVLDGSAMAPGERHLVQLRTEAPLAALPGDRFVLRRESPVQTLGGGVVLDPWAHRARKRDHGRVRAELEALEGGDRTVLLRRAGDAGLDANGAALRGVSDGTWLADRLFDAERVEGLARELLASVATWHREHPLAEGPPRRDLRRGPLAHLTDRTFDALIARCAEQGALVLSGPRVRLPDFEIRLDDALEDRRNAVLDGLAALGLQGRRAAELLATDADLVHLMLARGEIARVGDNLLAAPVLDELALRVRDLIGRAGKMDTSDFKDLTGLTRKHAIPLLEWLDASGVTRRQGDERVLA